MKLRLAAAAVFLLAACSTAFAQEEGFVQIFNGKDLTGWKGLDGFWSVKDGAIIGSATKEKSKQTFLVYVGEKGGGGDVKDFELRLKFKFATPTGNSGIQFRSKVVDEATYKVGGYQADFDATNAYTGIIYDEAGVAGKRGIMSKRGIKTHWGDGPKPDKEEPLEKNNDELKALIKVGDWNDVVLRAQGNHIVYQINGHTTTDLTDDSSKALTVGVLALQMHSGFTQEIHFKDIQLKTLAGGGAKAPATTQAAAGLAPGEAPSPKWIWRGRRTRDREVAYFRKSLTIKGEPSMARVTATADDEFELFVNGTSVAKSTGAADEWQKPISVDVTKLLTSGHNAIAVRAANRAGAAGLLAKLDVELTNGRRVNLVTDAAWVATSSEKPNWNTQDYSGSGWSAAQVIGDAGIEPWGEIDGLEGKGAAVAAATPAEKLRVLPGFKAELLYSVPKAREGSWVSMCFDDKGRIIVSDQSTTLFRVTLPKDGAPIKVEPLKVEIGQAQGLLYHNNSLYVNVNGSAAQGSGFYRVRDTDGDDQFDEVTLLKKFKGAGEHGPHAIRLGPDGKLYLVCGNFTDVPHGLARHSPHKNYQEDILLPRMPDANGHATGRMAPGGFVLRTDVDGKEWEMLGAGLRNTYDIAFNTDGEPFGFDSDMEWDIGAPWYMPTRVNHITSGAEFGWRYGSGRWPAYFVDSLGGYDVGIGSPTGVEFGTGAKFPAKYQRAFYILDWSYGTIHAMHFTPAGSTYTATFEPFVAGKPLPVTDIAIGPQDGAMYFTMGGRNTQSGLYRVSYAGDESTAPAGPVVDAEAAAAREQRRKLETFHGRVNAAAVDAAWPHLGSNDRAMRNAARIAIEWQDPATWADRALAERNPMAAITALCALARTGPAALQPRVLEALDSLNFTGRSESQQLDVLRVYAITFMRMGKPDEQTKAKLAAKFEPLFPASSFLLSRELSTLLVYVESPQVVAKAMSLVASSPTQEEQLEYVFQLRTMRVGWNESLRRQYFDWFNTRAPLYSGGNSFKGFIKNTRADAEKTLSDEDRVALADVLKATPVTPTAVAAPPAARAFVKEWTMKDLLPALDKVEHGRSFRKGREAFAAVGCNTCHKFAMQQADVGLGPDITGIGNRFSTFDLLESIVDPSKTVSDLYQTTEIRTSDDVLTGRVESDNGREVVLRVGPLVPPVKVAVKDIKSRRPSPVSTMPKNLLDNLTEDEILDLLAYLRAAGNPNDIAFQR